MSPESTGGVTQIMKPSIQQWVDIVGRLLFQSFSYKNATPAFSVGRTMLFFLTYVCQGSSILGIFSTPGCNQASALPQSTSQAFLNESEITITG